MLVKLHAERKSLEMRLIYVYINIKIVLICATVAVKRYYENLRRTFLEQKEDKVDVAELQAQRRKYRSRRERVR